jgi:hypothetical protein
VSLTRLYVAFVIERGARHVHLLSITRFPAGAWPPSWPASSPPAFPTPGAGSLI